MNSVIISVIKSQAHSNIVKRAAAVTGEAAKIFNKLSTRHKDFIDSVIRDCNILKEDLQKLQEATLVYQSL